MGTSSVQKHPRYRVDASVDVVTASAEMQKLALTDISLGGMFIRTNAPPPPGSAVRVRLFSTAPDATLGLMGRVVHVIDGAMGSRKAHPPGMGVQFEGLSPHTQALLEVFVDGLAQEARRARARFLGVARFVEGGAAVEVAAERAVLAELWSQQNLKHGGLYADGPPPARGTQVVVRMGSLVFRADVVHVDAGAGAGLQLLDFDGHKREAVRRFVEGVADGIAVEPAAFVGPPLGKVLAAARRLFDGLEANDGFGALGLPDTADDEAVRNRTLGLSRLFAADRPDATPPQRARIEAATRAVARLEPVLLARVAALRKQAELARLPPVGVEVGGHDEVKALIDEAVACERRGERDEARKLLARALEIAPQHAGATRRLAALNAAVDGERAADLLSSAEVFVQGVGMRDEAVRRAREAARLSILREIRLRALRVLIKAGEHTEAEQLAQEILDADPHDVHALQALMVLAERARDWRAAARAGEALLRLRPGDGELQRRVKKFVAAARAP